MNTDISLLENERLIEEGDKSNSKWITKFRSN